MKKNTIISIILIAILLIASMFVLTGCGEKTNTAPTPSGSNTTQTPSGSNTTQTPANSQSGVIQLPATIVNMCEGANITELYLSGAGLDNWGDDVLAGQTLNTNQQITLMLNIDSNNLKWDIKATDQTGESVEFLNLDLSNANTSGTTITLKMSEQGPIAVAE